MTPTTKALRKIARLEAEIKDIKRALLFETGWQESSDYPGSYWLWSKTFPQSNVQWRWEGQEKVMKEGFTVNGITLDMAITIESNWQELYWKGPLP